MKTKLIKSIKSAIPKQHRVNFFTCSEIYGEVANKIDYQLLIFFKSDKTVFHFWIGIIGKPKIDIEPLELEPMDKDGAVAFAKNHFIEKIKEIL